MSSKQLRHLGLIMDGNRRWAKKSGVKTIDGHREGYKNLKELLRTVKRLDIEFVSVYAFSTENWNRTKEEVEGLLGLVRWVLKNEVQSIIEEQLKIVFVGTNDNLPKDILKLMSEIEEKSADFSKGTLAICFNYGGQQEIVDAANAVVNSGQEITQESITQNLYQPGIPDIDLIIRTSGEQRLSNFMLWRSAYSEMVYTDTLWPDFKGSELEELVSSYESSDRRFGV